MTKQEIINKLINDVDSSQQLIHEYYMNDVVKLLRRRLHTLTKDELLLLTSSLTGGEVL